MHYPTCHSDIEDCFFLITALDGYWDKQAKLLSMAFEKNNLANNKISDSVINPAAIF